MSNLPAFENYGQYNSDNYGAHTMKVHLGTITLWYSYQTIVAYWDVTDGKIVCENVWSNTTGKHLNFIDGGDKKNRVEKSKFDEMLAIAIERHIK